MKKIFTLLTLMLLAMTQQAKAADVVIFSTDFKNTDVWPVGTITASTEKNGMYFNCENAITANGLEMSAGNVSAARWISIPLSNINKSFKAVFTVPSSNTHFVYLVSEGTDYTTARQPNITVNRNSSDGTAVIEYTMSGSGSDAILYFYRDGSARNKVEKIEITTPDPSAVTTATLTNVTVSGTALSDANLTTLQTDKALTYSDAVEGKPIVIFESSITVTDSEGSTTSEKSEKVIATKAEDSDNYSASYTAADGNTYVLTFTSVTCPEVLDITGRGMVEVRITQDTYLTQAYFTSTDTWASGVSIIGENDNYFNMAGGGRDVAIKVKGARKCEVLASNPNASEERTYRIAIDSNTPVTQTLEGASFISSGILDINSDGAEATLNILSDNLGIRLYKAIFYETEENIPTGISTVKAAQANDAVIYNLAGQKVTESYKGVVIKNGKKVVIK